MAFMEISTTIFMMDTTWHLGSHEVKEKVAPGMPVYGEEGCIKGATADIVQPMHTSGSRPTKLVSRSPPLLQGSHQRNAPPSWWWFVRPRQHDICELR
jgi:hypothetical protein